MSAPRLRELNMMMSVVLAFVSKFMNGEARKTGLILAGRA